MGQATKLRIVASGAIDRQTFSNASCGSGPSYSGTFGGVAAVFGSSGAASGADASVREFEPVQLADVETAFAMTVHKSQGSEYPKVVLILPPAASPLATRELVYTGATRAKQRLVVVGSDAALHQALAVRAMRMTGLTDALG